MGAISVYSKDGLYHVLQGGTDQYQPFTKLLLLCLLLLLLSIPLKLVLVLLLLIHYYY